MFYKELIAEIIKSKSSTVNEVLKIRRDLCRRHNPKTLPSLIQIFLHATPSQMKKLQFLTTKPTRTLSGVAPVAIMTSPEKCPHGKCLMCPGGPKSFFGEVPQSYTGKEPATMRGIRNEFDPYLQVFNRLEQYVILNQNFEKVELIIMGGTFPARTNEYQEEFVKYAFKALNDFGELFFKDNEFDFAKFKKFFLLPADLHDKVRIEKIKKKLFKLKKECDLQTEQNKNETTKVRCVGLTIETRPDYALLKEANQMLKLGCTRVELGIQSVYPNVLKYIDRGHRVSDSIIALEILKDLGFKINAHYMLGLPKTSKQKDLKGLKKLFSNQSFRPDMLKIYPCMVLPGTELEKLYYKKKFKPLSTKDAINILAEFKRYIPSYLRIMRIQRDIPTKRTIAGVDKTNLRQELHTYMEKKNIKCNCIRCREVGRSKKLGKVEITVEKYQASNGREYFIAAEDKENNTILGFCRMRFPFQFLRKEIGKKTALIRELHVYGIAAGLTEKGDTQHKGYGYKLMQKAEEIAKAEGKTKMVVISGIGVREYYIKKLDYQKEGPYMVKYIN